MQRIIFFFYILLFFSTYGLAEEKTVLRLGILAFGTVNWELTALKNFDLPETAYFQLEIHQVATPQAAKIALQGGTVDLIVSDWVWVARMRSTGADFTFYPYSTTAGALVVATNSPIQNISDLKATRLGIAGGELDKNWLLLQALASTKYQVDLDDTLEKIYAAPPLLNQQLLHGRIDGVMNYWHYAARLEARGYRQIINGMQLQQELGIEIPVPTLGYVFNRSWANAHKKALRSFLHATRNSKDLLCNSDEAWQQILPLTRTELQKTQQILRQRYCAGRIRNWGEKQQQAAEQVYTLLRKLSNNRLTGTSAQIPAGTFWFFE